MAAVFIARYYRDYCIMVGKKPFEVLVVCGPSGSGKSTLLKKLFEGNPDKFGFSVSHTTRSPRTGEENGVHYNFTDCDTFKQAVHDKKFLEYATYSGNMYGTSKSAVDSVVQKGKLCVLDVDVQGVKQLKDTNLEAIYVFIKTPSLTVLEERLRTRQTETEETLKKRLDAALQEIEYGETPGNFNLIITNDNIDKAYSTFQEFIFGEILKRNKAE